MGLSDKLKQFSDKAKESAAEHREQITNAVETAGVIADKRTRGRYSGKIAKVTAKTGAAVDRLAGEPGAHEGSSATPPGPEQPPAPEQPHSPEQPPSPEQPHSPEQPPPTA
jgi:hypothetical protein